MGYPQQRDEISLTVKRLKPKSSFPYNVNYGVSWLLALMQRPDDVVTKKTGDTLHLSFTTPG